MYVCFTFSEMFLDWMSFQDDETLIHDHVYSLQKQ